MVMLIVRACVVNRNIHWLFVFSHDCLTAFIDYLTGCYSSWLLASSKLGLKFSPFQNSSSRTTKLRVGMMGLRWENEFGYNWIQNTTGIGVACMRWMRSADGDWDVWIPRRGRGSTSNNTDEEFLLTRYPEFGVSTQIIYFFFLSSIKQCLEQWVVEQPNFDYKPFLVFPNIHYKMALGNILGDSFFFMHWCPIPTTTFAAPFISTARKRFDSAINLLQ